MCIRDRFFLIFEPEAKELPGVAIAIAVGFATFENVCYLAENGAANFTFLLIRGISAGALHILCGIFTGFGISYLFRRRWLALTGTVGVLGACVGFHAIYNLLVTACLLYTSPPTCPTTPPSWACSSAPLGVCTCLLYTSRCV